MGPPRFGIERTVHAGRGPRQRRPTADRAREASTEAAPAASVMAGHLVANLEPPRPVRGGPIVRRERIRRVGPMTYVDLLRPLPSGTSIAHRVAQEVGMRCREAAVGLIVLVGAVRGASAGALAPRMVVEDASRKNHLVTILGANLVMVGGLNRVQVAPVMGALDRYLDARLAANQPAVVYPEVVLSIVKAAVLRGWVPGDTATVLVGALRRIDEGDSPELTKQKVVLAIVKNEKAPAVLATLTADAAAAREAAPH